MPDTSLYRPTLKKAWQIAWKFKSLWILGFFATLLSSGGEYEIITRFFYGQGAKGIIGNIVDAFTSGVSIGLQGGGNLWVNMMTALTTAPAATLMGLLLLILAIIITIFFIWLGITSQIGLIRNIATINKNKKVTINEGFEYGVRNFWPVFWSTVVLKVALFIVFLIFGLIAALLTDGVWQTIAYFVIFVVFIIATLLVSVIPKFQMLFIILNKEGFMPALKSGWQLFKNNWLICLEMALVLLGVYIIGWIVSGFASALLTAVPFVVIPMYFPTIAPIAAYIIMGLCMILMVVIIVLVAAFVTTYQWAAWTLLFNRITGGEQESKILRTVTQIQNWPSNFSSK